MLKFSLFGRTSPAWAMLGAGLLVTVFASLQVKQGIEQTAVRQFAFTCDQVTLKIQERLGAYALILRGGAALFAASIAVDRQEWRAYVETLRAEGSVPGVQGIGFAQLIPADELATHIAQIRGEGFPDYTVRPSGERPIYTSIIYLEPFRDRNLSAFGFDMFSEPVRRAAMEHARDSGAAALSGKVELVQETGTDVQAGTLMYVPVYRNGWPRDTLGQRRAALIGWAYSPYRMNDLMAGILRYWESHEGKTVDLHIYDGPQATPATLLFDSNTAPSPDLHSLFYQQRTLDFNGHQWLLIFDRTVTPSGINYTDAWAALIGGLALSGLLFGLMLSRINTRVNAARIANQLTEEIRRRSEALKESEYRWKFAIEGSGDGLWDWNVAAGTVFFSKRWKAMLGFAEDEIGTGLDEWQKRIHPDDKANALAAMQNCLDGKTPIYVSEHRVRCKDGSSKWILDRGMVVSRSEDGKPLRMIGTHTDITERKLVEQKLLGSEQRLRLHVDQTPLGVIEWDTDFRVVRWNPSAERIFGYTAAEAMGRHASFIVADDARGSVDDVWSHLLAGQGGERSTISNMTKDGRMILCEWYNTPLSMSDGKVIGIASLVEDVTERKLAQEALARKERYYRKMIEGGSDVFFLIDRAGTLLYRSESGKQLTGWETAEVLGKPVTDYVPAESLPLVRNAITEAFAKPDQLTRVEMSMLRKDGTQVEIEALAKNLLDDPDIAGIVITARDISKRKLAEEALRRLNRALRTLSACNEALVRAGTESELLSSICRLIVETSGYRMAWVGFPEQDAAKTVRPVAHFGHEEGYLATAKISWADNELGRGPTGTALRTGTVQVNQNFLSDPALAPWREAGQQRGYQSSIALPIKNSAGTLGVLVIYASEPDAFNEAEVALLQELAGDLAFGIETLRTRVERDRIAYEQLHHAEILRQNLEDSIKAIAATVEMRDAYTAGHQRRVGQLAVAIARELGLPEGTSRGIELAASIHDLGKISVPAEILSKPGKLTAIELMLVKTHAQAGYDILKDIKFPWPIATMVWQHHERLDGSGYPQGLKGDQILLESRIMAVADVVEAMASHRPYRAALGIDIALKAIEQGRGTAYDAAVVDACIRLFAEKRFAFST